MDKTQVDENLKELLTSNINEIFAMEKNAPEIYGAFTQLLSAIDSKYGSGEASKNLTYLSSSVSSKQPTVKKDILYIEIIEDNPSSGRTWKVYSWWQLERFLDILYNLRYFVTKYVDVKMYWNGYAPNQRIKCEIELERYYEGKNRFIGEDIKMVLEGTRKEDGIIGITTESKYKDMLPNIDFDGGEMEAKPLTVLTPLVAYENRWDYVQYVVLRRYQKQEFNTELTVQFDSKNAWSDKDIQYRLDFAWFLRQNNIESPQYPNIPSQAFIGYILFDATNQLFGQPPILNGLPTAIFDSPNKIEGFDVLDYDWGNAYRVWEDLYTNERTLLEFWDVKAKPTNQTKSVKSTPSSTSNSSSLPYLLQKSTWTSDWKYLGVRPSPERPASKESLKSIGLGNDGGIYKISKDKNGVLRWVKDKTLKLKDINPSIFTSLDDLEKAVAILENDIKSSIGILDKEDIAELKSKQLEFAQAWDKK